MKKFSYIIIILLILLIGYINLNKKNIQTETFEDTKINLQNCSISELIKVPGIGYSKAQSILDYQKNIGFHTIEDLKNVYGIGVNTYNKIKNYFYLNVKSYEFTKNKINLNFSNKELLKTLPGIGEKTAERILNYRKLKKISNFDDLKKLKIPNSTIIQLKGLVEF